MMPEACDRHNAMRPTAPETAHEHFTWKLARAALARNDTFNWRLIENPGRLRIQTIDSLCATFVRQMPWVSRLGAPPHPEDDVAHLYRQAATGTLQMLDSVKGGVNLDHFGGAKVDQLVKG